MLGFARASQAAAIAASILILAGAAAAQERGRSPNFFDNLFGGTTAQAPAQRGVDEADLAVQINQLQAQIRQLTGTIEQLQYRNQQLEQQVRALQGNPGAGPTPGPVAASGVVPGSGAVGSGGAGYPVHQQPPRGMQQASPPPQNYAQTAELSTARYYGRTRPPLRRIRSDAKSACAGRAARTWLAVDHCRAR